MILWYIKQTNINKKYNDTKKIDQNNNKKKKPPTP